MNKYLTVNRIEFAVTYLCNSRCIHCYNTKDKESYPNHIDESIAIEMIRKICENYHPESIMTFGGEPLLFPDLIYSIHGEAKKAGIQSRQVITNGFWSKNPQKIEKIAKNLVTSGVNDILFSVDAFHQEHIPIETVKHAVKVCLGKNIKTIGLNPCWIISKEHDNPYNRKTRAILQEFGDLSIEISEGNIIEPEGFALTNLAEFLPMKGKIPCGKCKDVPYADPLNAVKAICVEPTGDIAVCNDFHIGNILKTEIIDIIESYNPYNISEMKAILENGMHGLENWAKLKGIDPNPEGYYSICDMCTKIRKQVNQKTIYN